MLYFFSGILIVSPIESSAQKDQPINTTLTSSSQVSSLQISLLTDKTSYSIGDEIHFEAVFFNRGNLPFRILIDDTFIGENIQCAGRIFSLLKPNKYRLTYIYETINADKHWKFSAEKTLQETSLDLLWIGKTTSNPIEISIQ